jgi:hypothetical protein
MKRLISGSPNRWLVLGVLVLLLTVFGLQAANPHSYVAEAVARIGESGSGPDAALTDLTKIDQLTVVFNRDAGDPRLILLFSPT